MTRWRQGYIVSGIITIITYMRIVTRQESLARGLNRYYTGKACRNGHVSERYTLNSACIECVVDNTRREREKFRELKANVA